MTGGQILAVFFSIIMGSIALGQLVPPLTAFTTAKTAVGQMFEVINREPLIDGFSVEGEKPKERPNGAIELNNVFFAYPSRPELMVCRGYNLRINPGETVALVGASGCGKSTIINLLLRFFDPISGSVTLDGKDLKDLNIRWLRNQIGYVGQEPVLFSGSIHDNIAYGINPDVVDTHMSNSAKPLTDAELHKRVEYAAKQANAHEFIENFPDGYDTDVGSNGIASALPPTTLELPC